jgi:hypothetical protein
MATLSVCAANADDEHTQASRAAPSIEVKGLIIMVSPGGLFIYSFMCLLGRRAFAGREFRGC